MSDVCETAVDSLADERFRLASRAEIVVLLRELQARRPLVTATGANGASFVTVVVAVNPDFEEVVFDWGGDIHATERVLRSTRIVFETTLDHVRVRFVAEHAQHVVVDDTPAFRVRIPSSIYRLQRRESYRLRVPQSTRAVCEVPSLAPPGKSAPALRLHDLSEGGVALAGLPKGCTVRSGDRLDRCRLMLTDQDPIGVDLEVVHVVADSGVPSRLGARFVALPSQHAVAIRRFITRVERDLRART
jgi:c-di-GMP-binding flagellar brake protein YcgR